ncbi:MAG TPA: hypothetical protein VGM54_13350 [Chthoniobacter sp.]|jgi:hypothetical protein
MNYDNRTAGLSSPANNSLQTSLYIALLDRYLGIRGLVSPVVDEDAKLDYDFFHPKSGRVIKIFKSLQPEEIEKYAISGREENIFIVDAVALDSTTCEGCGEPQPDIDSEELIEAAVVLNAYLYFDDTLNRWDEEVGKWAIMMPYERERCMDAIFNLDDE